MMKMARPLMAPKMVFTFWASAACRWERVSMVSSLRAATRGSRAASTAASLAVGGVHQQAGVEGVVGHPALGHRLRQEEPALQQLVVPVVLVIEDAQHGHRPPAGPVPSK